MPNGNGGALQTLRYGEATVQTHSSVCKFPLPTPEPADGEAGTLETALGWGCDVTVLAVSESV